MFMHLVVSLRIELFSVPTTSFFDFFSRRMATSKKPLWYILTAKHSEKTQRVQRIWRTLLNCYIRRASAVKK